MIGISNYDETHLPSIDGIYSDYQNVRHTFNFIRGYSMVYLNEKDQLIYIHEKVDKKDDVDDKFKLKWTCDHIDMFNEQIKENILHDNGKYIHDSLIYFISSHGNRDELIYDSNGEEYSLAFIYNEFNNQNCKLLRNKPKIFIVDADRADVNVKTHRASLSQSLSRAVKTTNGSNNNNIEKKTDDVQSLANKKTFTKDEHFRKIFCNTKDSKFVDGGKMGSFLIQSITTAFSNDKYFLGASLSDIVRQTRIIMTQLTGMKQNQPLPVTIHDRNSLPYKVKFLSSCQSSHDDKKEFEFFANAPGTSINNMESKESTSADASVAIMSINKPLIVFLGIGTYEKGVFSNLDCVPTDFENIVKSMNYKRGFDIGYYTNDGKLKVIEGPVKSISTHVKQLKLKWDESDIFSFNEMVYKSVSSKNNIKYDCLMYFISCHGDSGGIIYDSKGEKLPLITIFDAFNNLNCLSLRNKPKIYWVSACRGGMRTKRFKNSGYKSIGGNNYNNDNDNVNTDAKTNDVEEDNQMELKSTEDEMNIMNDLSYNDAKNAELGVIVEEKQYELLSKEKKTKDEISQSSNVNHDNLRLFSKFNWNRIIYANTDGYGVVEPGSKGEYMIRSVTKAFDNDDIFNMDFDQIMVQIRQILVKLMGQSESCAAQVIDDHNDIPAKLFFKAKTANNLA